MSVPHFQCLRCGECCKKLRKEVASGVVQGLFLFPKEVKLVKSLARQHGLKISIKPQQAIGKKRHGKPRLRKTFSYQIADLMCPFFDEKTNACIIYEKRPTACRAFPITKTQGNRIVIASDCTWSMKRDAKPKEKVLIMGLDEEWRFAHRIDSYLMEKLWADPSPWMWVFNLRSNSWQRGLKRKE
ncbi:MAG: YkgJ family cysteine cluster protein [Promethearchaeota archaeon]